MSRSRIVNLANLEQFTAINVLSDPGVIGGPVVVPEAIRVMIVFTLTDGKTARMILCGRAAPAFAPTPTIAEAIRAALVAGATWTALNAHLSPTGALARVDLQDIRSAGQPVVSSTGAAVVGASTGVALPDETAACLTFRTALVGAGHRGRAYFPNWATTALATGNVIASAAFNALANWGQSNIASAMTAGGLVHALALPARAAYTGSTGTSHPARAAHVENVTFVTVRDNHWDSQRRRGLK